MLKLRLPLVVLTCAMAMLTAVADSEGGQNKSNSDPGTAILHQKKTASNRPNIPSHTFIECEYGDGFLKFSFPDGIYSVSVHLYNDSDNWWGMATVEESYIETPSFTGDYIIECTSDDGRTFSGEIIF